MRNLALLAAVASLTLVVATSAGAAGSPAPGTIAADLCSKLQARLGTATFGSLLGSSDACATTLVTAYDTCKSSGAPGSTPFRSCAHADVVAAVKQELRSTKGPELVIAAGKLTQNVCAALQTRNGAGFATVFTDVSNCESKLTAFATTTIQSCVATATPGTSDFRSCLKSTLVSAATKLRSVR